MVKSDSNLSVDMVVVMPVSIFQEKDYLNYRYFYKRAYYLACIAAGLQQAVQDEFNLAFEYFHGNDLQPILIARPKLGKRAQSGQSNFMLTYFSRQNKARVELCNPHHSCCTSRLLCRIKTASEQKCHTTKGRR
jgi:hypothetical protein